MDNFQIRLTRLVDQVRKNHPTVDESRLRRAYELAEKAHEGQKRKAGDPYITHPLAVAEIIAEMELDADSIIAALLHDTVEDTFVTSEQILREFGQDVADIVDGVTKLENIPFSSKQDEEMENLRKMFFAMAKDIRVILVKLADRLHNMRTVAYLSDLRQREMSLETMEIYAPIAHRLGIQKIKWELEDLCLKYLDPVGYNEITTNLRKKESEKAVLLNVIMKRIEEGAAAHVSGAHIEGRLKHIYSIYRKMYGQHKNFDEVYDLYAIRVIVHSITECYAVLGIIHDIFNPIPGRFKDYIGTPKPNMYQSLHTTVIGREGTPFEVQIRTWDMHHTAEYGIAAHWKYKDGQAGESSLDERLTWVRQLLETVPESDAEEFFTSFKVDMFGDQVFVFTPNGDVIGLPTAATAIDFAYAIHSAVGNRMVGAKANGKIIPIDSSLQNGDIIEIITQKNGKGPSRDWLKIVKTSEARNKIRQWFKKEKRDENISEGRQVFERELKRTGIPLTVLQEEALITTVCKKFSYPTLDDLFASIGYGGITVNRAMNRLREEYYKVHKPVVEEVIETEEFKAKLPKTSQNGIIVKGIDNCLVKFARCCTPIPGDDITGFITRGYGVSIHRTDCPNVVASLNTEGEQDRWIEVFWADDAKSRASYTTSLQILCKDRISLLADLATTLSNLKVNIRSLQSKDTHDHFVVITFVFETVGLDHLSNIMTKLRKITGVIDVTRTVE